MAGVPSRDRAGFEEHVRRVLSDDANVFLVIDVNGEVAGTALSWPSDDGRRYVGYWLGREYWGRGLATRALAELIEELPRPLHALVSTTNVASIRVLQKCGFVEIGPADDKYAKEGVPGLLFELQDA